MLNAVKEKFDLRIKYLLRQFYSDKSNNLKLRLLERATDSSCEYIENNMAHVKSVNTNFKVMDEALSHVKIEGLKLEFGVFSGRTINHIAEFFKKDKIYGFDSFEGLPEFWRDGFDKGFFDVKNNLPKVSENVELVKGWFNETLPGFVQDKRENVAFLHVDCDLYSSTKTIFKELAPFIVSGTVIVFDEYFNYPGWQQGEFKAFQEFVAQYHVEYEYITYNNRHEQVALIIKKISNS